MSWCPMELCVTVDRGGGIPCGIHVELSVMVSDIPPLSIIVLSACHRHLHFSRNDFALYPTLLWIFICEGQTPIFATHTHTPSSASRCLVAAMDQACHQHLYPEVMADDMNPLSIIAGADCIQRCCPWVEKDKNTPGDKKMFLGPTDLSKDVFKYDVDSMQ